MYEFRRSQYLYTKSDVTSDVRLPSFICIGAPKCATTWLFECLAAHPEVFVPDFKEVNFFTVCRWGKDYETKGIDYYASLFAGAEPNQIVGDFSPNLMQDPFAPERVAALVPDVRLIVMIRDPISRTHSHYHYVRNRARRLKYSLRDVIDDPSRDHAGYLSQGLYGEQLERWLEYFPMERFLVIETEKVREKPQQVFRRTCEFLEVDSSFQPPLLQNRVNPAKTVRLPVLYRWNVRASRFLTAHGLDRVRSMLKGLGLPKFVQSLNERPIDNPPLTRRDLDDLVEFYRDDIALLSRLLGRDFSSWLEVVDDTQ